MTLPFEVPADTGDHPPYMLFNVDYVLVDLHRRPVTTMMQLAREA
jgi:hypothetical protein